MKKFGFTCVIAMMVLGLLAGCGIENILRDLMPGQVNIGWGSSSERGGLPGDADVGEKTYGYGQTIDYDVNTDKGYVGAWKEKNGEAVFILKEDGTCGFFKSIYDLENNFYWGNHIGALQGEDALIDLGVAEDERTMEPYRDPSKTYSLRLWYDTLYSEGIDKSEMVEGKFDWYMFGKFSDGGVTFVNMNTFTVIEVEEVELDIEKPAH